VSVYRLLGCRHIVGKTRVAVVTGGVARNLEPEDVARTVAFLAGEGGAALTGKVLCVDGGLVLR
jgi:NAD(P)-dependent dehydrogenase (short-subunit alcohol dehydrogenase family)